MVNTTNKLLLINFILGLMILILPVTLISIPKGSSLVVLMLIISILGLSFNRNSLELNKMEKFFIFSFSFYVATIAINLWWFDGYVRDIDTPSRLLLVLPIYFFIRKFEINVNWFIWGVALGAVAAGMIKLGVIDVVYLSKVVTVQTGIFSLFSSIFGLSSIMFIRRGNPHIKNVLLSVAFALGMVASFMSGGRGVWIAAVLSLMLTLAINPIQWSIKSKLLALLSFFVLFYSAYSIPQTGVKNKIFTAITNTTGWVQNGQANTSSGARLEMWKASFEVIKENPIFGVGEDNYAKHQQKLIDQGKIDKSVGDFLHPHGEYITSLVEQGAIGLLAFILILFAPIKYLLSHIRSELYEHENKPLIASGLIVVLHYLFYSFTSGVFDHQSTTLFYAVFIATILGLIQSNSRTKV
jgi:O-antigen ligase